MSGQPQVPEMLVEELRDLEWAQSCSPAGPARDSPEWARMRLEALYPAIEAELRAGLIKAIQRNISFLRSEASAGRELANHTLDWDERQKYRVRAEAYEWAADNFEAALAGQPQGCPNDPICDTCPASTEDDVCLPHEREAAEARRPPSEETHAEEVARWERRYHAMKGERDELRGKLNLANGQITSLRAALTLSGEDKARLELIRDHDGNDLSENDQALLTRLASRTPDPNDDQQSATAKRATRQRSKATNPDSMGSDKGSG